MILPTEDTPNFPKPPKRKNSFINGETSGVPSRGMWALDYFNQFCAFVKNPSWELTYYLHPSHVWSRWFSELPFQGGICYGSFLEGVILHWFLISTFNPNRCLTPHDVTPMPHDTFDGFVFNLTWAVFISPWLVVWDKGLYYLFMSGIFISQYKDP